MARSTGRLGARLADLHGSTVEFGSIQLRDGRFCVPLFRHFDEGETTRLTGTAIRHDVDPLDTAILREGGLQVLLGRLVAEISDKDVGHKDPFIRVKLSLLKLRSNPTSGPRRGGKALVMKRMLAKTTSL